MTRETISIALNYLDDRFISESASFSISSSSKKIVHMKKRIISIAMAAALIIVLGITAYAVYVHWSRGMEQLLPATEQEKELAEQSGLSESPESISVTANGVTISVEQTIIDDDTANIALRIEGWSIDKAQETNVMLWGGLPTFDGETAPAMGGSFVEERDANNHVSIIAPDGSIEYDIWAKAGDKLGTLSGKEIHIIIESLGISGKGEPYQPLVEGPWELTWTPSNNSDCLIVRPEVTIGDTEIKLLSAEINSVSARVLLQLPLFWDGYKTLEHHNLQLVGVRLKDGTVLTNIFGSPTYEGYSDIDNLTFNLCYSSRKILQPEQVDALIFASNLPWERLLSDSELIYVPIV